MFDPRDFAKRRRFCALSAAAASAVLAASSVSMAGLPQYQISTLGLTDAQHTRDDGFQAAGVDLLNDVGQTAGRSTRYNAGPNSLGFSAWLFNGTSNVRIGLIDAFHTGADGTQNSEPLLLNNSGRVVGSSVQYNAGLSEVGQSAWLYANGSTIRLGLTDSAHTAADGSSNSEPTALNEANQVLGYSSRFAGADANGQSLWLYNNGATARIGLTDAQHTSSSGEQFSYNGYLNQSGQVAGNSTRYAGSVELGNTAWLYNAGTYTQVGLVDAQHTSSSGERQNGIYTLDNAGRVSGYALRYNGTIDAGQSIWIAAGGITTRVGLTNAEHTASDGYQYSSEWDANSAGQVAGTSHRYNGGADDLGYSSWIYNGTTSQRVGFSGAGYTDTDGYQASGIYHFNNTGYAYGYSERYGGGLYRGDAAWVAHNGATTRIGLITAAHTDSTGFQYSEGTRMNTTGQVIGFSNHFVSDEWVGDDAWLWNGTSTIQLGMIDSQHTASDGTRTSYAYYINDAGQVTGESDRYNANTYAGQSGWFYNPGTGQTTPLIFGVGSDGYAYTEPWDLSSDGAVIGTYERFNAGVDNGLSMFYWSLANGFHDIGGLIPGGLAAAGWDVLDDPRDDRNVNGFPYIVGYGERTSGMTMPFLLRALGGGAWANNAGGSWHTAGNWSLGSVPSANDDAIFNLANNYTVSFSSDAQAHGLNVSAGQVTFSLAGHHLDVTDTTHIGTATVTLSGAGTLRTAAVTLDAGARLDIADSSVIIDYTGGSPLASIRSSILSGKIRSGLADVHKVIGSAENSVLGRATFGGESVDATSILLQLTFSGDANLDGKVDVTDLGALATHWQTSDVWTGGDFNYDGFVDVSDLGALATNWQAGVGSPLGPGSLDDAMLAAGLADVAVPEPAALGALIVASAAALSRRRRR
jgi:hypothetical protein